ncbi:hypothetical protein WJX77_002248 [Trebouxia sp. C0004]
MDATPRRDAFSVLTSSAKRKRPSTQDAGQASSFRTCPVCELAVPRALLQNHAENCKGAVASGVGLSSTSAGKAKVTVELQTNVPGSEADLAQLTASSSAPSTFKGSPSLLKSALQKNVRLCRAAPAVRCALQLMKANPADFLRRVSIICLEDALLHPDMPLLVWLMCAQTKGYALGCTAASACLRIVHQLASVPVRDAYPIQIDAPSDSEAGSQVNISAKEELMVRCILIRAAYGGMAGDVTMLKTFAATWKFRFFRGHACPHALPSGHHEVANANKDKQLALDPRHTWHSYIQETYSRLGMPPGGVLAVAKSPLRRGDIPLSAVDFHISSIVEELMQVPSILAAAKSLEAQTDMNDSLRRAMWLFRSGLNSKTQVSTGSRLVGSHERKTLQPLWQAAHAAADAWSADYIRQRFG